MFVHMYIRISCTHTLFTWLVEFCVFTHFMMEAVHCQFYYGISLRLVVSGPIPVHHGVRCEEAAFYFPFFLPPLGYIAFLYASVGGSNSLNLKSSKK